MGVEVVMEGWEWGVGRVGDQTDQEDGREHVDDTVLKRVRAPYGNVTGQRSDAALGTST